MRLTLIERRNETPDIESFIFAPQEKLTWKAGQFLHYVLHHEPTDDRGSDRWFTVASAPCEGRVMITTRLAHERGSTFKEALKALKVHDILEISDIDGDFIVEDTSREYIFIAGGIGITPFRSILKELAYAKVQLTVTLLWANRDANIPYKDEFESLASNNPNLRIIYVTAPERITIQKIQALVPDLQKPLYYISGPEPLVESLGTELLQAGIKKENIKQDWFPGYPLD